MEIINMKKNRHSKIIEIMEKENVISIKKLAELLNCTEMTVRRNLDELQNMNFVKRERGYATLLQNAKATDYYIQIDENTKEFRTVEGKYVPDTWVKRKPARRFLQLSSAPLSVPHGVDSWFVAKVL